MPVTIADQHHPGARQRVRTKVTAASGYPPKSIPCISRKDMQMEVPQIVERPIVLQQRDAVAAQRVLEQLGHCLGGFGNLGQQFIWKIGEIRQMRSRADQDVPWIDGGMVQETDDAVGLVYDMGG